MRVEGGPPGGSSIGKEYVNVIGRLGYLSCEPLNLGDFGGVGRDRDGNGAGPLVREGIESGDGFFAGFGFARGDVDL
jgi:hypothetical protein